MSRRYEFRRKFVKKSTKFTFLYAEGAVIARKKRKFTQNAPLFLHIFFPRDTRIVHTLFTPNLGSLKESTLYFSHSLKQRATNKKFWGPLSTSPNGQSGRPRKTPRRGVMIKIKDQCKQTAPARVFHLSLAGAAILHFELNSLRGPFQILPRPARAVCGWGGAAGDLFALAAL